MRRLRGPQPHVTVRCDHDGRRLMSRRMATELSGRNPSVVHRAVEPVACDVQTRVLLIPYEALVAALPPLLPVPRRPVD